MTAKAVTISSDSFRPSEFARNLKISDNPLYSFKELAIRKRSYLLLAIIAAITGVMLAISQVFGANDHNADNHSSSGNTSSSNQQPPKDTSSSEQTTSKNTNAKSTSNTGSTSNSSSTSITVNGQPIDVPQTGSYDKSVNVSGSNVHVSGNTTQSTTGGSATNSSSTNVEINSE